MRLNKFLAHAGIASRRKCDELIRDGHVKVNGQTVREMGVTIDEHRDMVTFKGEKVLLQEKYAYVLLNKPPGFVSTASDEHKRNTVLDLVGLPERIYPVGRLDYNTTGVLLLTNDGELTNCLLHPNFKVEKIYHAFINEKVRPVDLHRLQKGIELDGEMTLPCTMREIRIVDNCSFLEIILREGRNRQIRRMFEVLHYNVEELERISFAGITARNLQPGEWRYLKDDELARLKEEVHYGH